MPVAPHIRRLRDKVGHDLLVLPSVAVLPRDRAGRVLLVRISDTGQWAAIGGAIEPDESPQESALRETAEEAGVQVRLGALLGVLGGPEYRITYPNGDQTAYVSTVFEAEVIGGSPTPDGDETVDVAWWAPGELPYGEMSTFTRALLTAVGLGPGDGPRS
jgi:8-oxo-dGTP pyrophosphatase MutT (NUDIX family)